MQKQVRAVVGVLTLLTALSGAHVAAQQVQGQSPIEEIRNALLKLPYYGVFDYLAFTYDKGTVTLVGYAYHPSLKHDAERALKRVAGVDQIVNRIEELPPSPMDEELRWKVYYAIYGDPFLSRYHPGGGVLWGFPSSRIMDPAFHPIGVDPFTGFEPAGDFPIHIIVKNGHVMLFGVVDNEADKRMAEIRAREVPLSFGVENHLIVFNPSQSSRK
jgi:hypothetical protein